MRCKYILHLILFHISLVANEIETQLRSQPAILKSWLTIEPAQCREGILHLKLLIYFILFIFSHLRFKKHFKRTIGPEFAMSPLTSGADKNQEVMGVGTVEKVMARTKTRRYYRIPNHT